MAKTTAKKTIRHPAKRTAPARAVKKPAPFRLTYATMFDPPEALHRSFERALAKVKAGLGRDYPMLIGGKERFLGYLALLEEIVSGALGATESKPVMGWKPV